MSSDIPTHDGGKPGLVPGTESHTAQVRGLTYHYMQANPDGERKGTILLLHGFPDFSYGWRNQIPMLRELGYQVIVPDMVGYGGTDSPYELHRFTMMEVSHDLEDLMGQIVPGEKILVGGHDWGAVLAHKFALWKSELIKAFFTVSVAYQPPVFGVSKEWLELSGLVNDGTLPHYGYQLQWREESSHEAYPNDTKIRQFLNAMFGGLTPDGRPAISFHTGINHEILAELQPNALISAADMDRYVEAFSRNGMRGPFNWYRTRKLNWQDELQLLSHGPVRFNMPSLYLDSAKDDLFSEEDFEKMRSHFKDLKIERLDTGHWALLEAPELVNASVKKWLAELKF